MMIEGGGAVLTATRLGHDTAPIVTADAGTKPVAFLQEMSGP